MVAEAPWFAQQLQQKPPRFAFLRGPDIFLHRPLPADKPGNESTVLTEACTVRGENERVLPPDELAAHLEYRPVAVDLASLVKECARIFDVVEDDEGFAEDGDADDRPYVE